jgi:hypothetical protein
VHLSRISVAEFAHLEIDVDETTQSMVKKQEIDAEPGIIESQSTLTANKSKIVAQFR